VGSNPAAPTIEIKGFHMTPCLVYFTVPTLAVAEQLAERLIHGQLAACVNTLPSMQSIYR
jgi:uncharacterized protein involved in tolerance to divalent cations